MLIAHRDAGIPTRYEHLDISKEEDHTGLLTRLQQARSWIDECQLEHNCEELPKLRSINEGNMISGESLALMDQAVPELLSLQPLHVSSENFPPLPQRVLDLRDFQTRGELRLFDGSSTRGVYACLSYCWGTQNSCLTTRATLEHHFKGIPFDSLPQTYKDAVLVTSNLKIPFLWIDALCIIQDDIGYKDWQEHSAQMVDIYGNSVVTIAATSTSNVCEGFLNISGPFVEPFVFQKSSQGHSRFMTAEAPTPPPLTVYARRLLDHIWLASNKWATKDKIATKPLWSRGWCFQEEFLSPRVLGFYGDEMNFQCREGHHCECGLRHRDPHDTNSMQSMKAILLAEFYSYEPGTSVNSFWQSIIFDYSRRNLTVATDRLPALSGVARVIQGLFGARYLAGHWHDEKFIFSLCWQAACSTSSAPRFSKYVGPSWSWVSLPAGITRTNPLEDNYTLVKGTEVLAVETTLATADKTGAVLGGYLVVRGAFLDVEFVETAQGPTVRRNGVDIKFTLDQQPGPSSSVANPPRVICWYLCFGDFDDGYRCSWSMILKVIQEHPRRICQRIGYQDLWCYKRDSEMAFFKDFRKFIGGIAII
jgi:hypothetical protein